MFKSIGKIAITLLTIFTIFLVFRYGYYLVSDNKDSFTTYTELCVDGHIYLQISTPRDTSIVPKLDDNGKPVKCKDVK